MLRVNGLKKSFSDKQKEAEANLQVKQQLKAAQKRVSELKGKQKSGKGELEKLGDVSRDTYNLHRQNESLKKKLANQEEQVREKYQARVEEEKRQLIEENENDCAIRMKMAWKALHPDDKYSDWEYHFKQPTDELDEEWLQAEKKGEADGDEDMAENEDFEHDGGHPTDAGEKPDGNVEESSPQDDQF
ncbi:uncharacterized protein LOC110687675 [Chenopodium quinoa]|uniref:uncharacterized protein LOC110687675 n=1 Tax=Chenopodium quinoa TaxID=63459 RepID=UPI000B79A7D0|nr:uncharacterized protein LOC110687675 [Chenopodium quinoa]